MTEKTACKQRLLIVDDSKVIRVTARKILSNHFDTVEAVDGENAWELLTGEEAFTLVVSDLTMPKLDGFGLLERIRKSHLPHIREIPVIIITGANDTETTMDQARQAGATDFISKPFDSIHLLARTQAHASSLSINQSLRVENAALEDRVTVDALTGLGNETAFMEHGYQSLAYATRHDKHLAVVRIEIDDYGILFSQFGNSLAEHVIVEVARVLKMTLRQEDTVARTGAARFSLLLPDMDRSGIRKMTQRLSREIGARLYKSGETGFRVTTSIGVAYPAIRRDTRLEDLLAVADRHLTSALEHGGNRVICAATDITTHTDNGIQVNEIESFIHGISLEHMQVNDEAAMEMSNYPDELPGSLANTFGGPVPENTSRIEITSPSAARTHNAVARQTPPGQTGHRVNAERIIAETAEKPAKARRPGSGQDVRSQHANDGDPLVGPAVTTVHHESITMHTTPDGDLGIVYEETLDRKERMEKTTRRAGMLRRIWSCLTKPR